MLQPLEKCIINHTPIRIAFVLGTSVWTIGEELNRRVRKCEYMYLIFHNLRVEVYSGRCLFERGQSSVLEFGVSA